MKPLHRHPPRRALARRIAGPLLLAALWSPTLLADADIRVSDAWLRALPAVSRVNSAYLEIHNGGERDDRLLAVRSPLAEAVTIHRSVQIDNAYRMQPVEALPIPAGTRVTLQSGAHHLMLTGVRRSPAAGERVPLTLTFERAGDIQVQAEVRPRERAAPRESAATGHQHH